MTVAVQPKLFEDTAPPALTDVGDTEVSEWAWIAVDPDGRCFGVADSFRSCLDEARDVPDVVLDQIVRVPAANVRLGIYWSRVEVTVRAGAPLELAFP